MKVTVDVDRCRGHGVCWSTCPAVFDLTDEGFAEVLVDLVPTEHEEAVEKAVRYCPERAIVVTSPREQR